MPESYDTIPTDPIHETSAVWREAGFIPPDFLRTVVEILHRLNNDDIGNTYYLGIIPELIKEVDEKNISGCSEYVFTNKEKMYHFAEEMNIPTKGTSDLEIAEEIFFRLIDEYIEEPFIFHKKEYVIELFSRFSTCTT